MFLNVVSTNFTDGGRSWIRQFRLNLFKFSTAETMVLPSSLPDHGLLKPAENWLCTKWSNTFVKVVWREWIMFCLFLLQFFEKNVEKHQEYQQHFQSLVVSQENIFLWILLVQSYSYSWFSYQLCWGFLNSINIALFKINCSPKKKTFLFTWHLQNCFQQNSLDCSCSVIS